MRVPAMPERGKNTSAKNILKQVMATSFLLLAQFSFFGASNVILR